MGVLHLARVIVALALALIGLAVLIIIAPFLLVAAVIFMALAWKRPSAAERVTMHQRLTPVPEAVRGTAPLELKRLYVARAWHGRRVAQALMDAAIDAAHARGAQTLWLGVWERNPRAVAFYTKYGFARVGEHTFVLGGDPQTDWLLARPIT